MPDTAADGTDRISRTRTLTSVVAAPIMPEIVVEDPDGNFRYSPTLREFTFDPVERGEVTADVLFRTPGSGGVEIGRLRLLGAGEVQKVYIDRTRMIEAMEFIASPAFTHATDEEKRIVDTTGERSTIAERVLEQVRFLLRDFRGAWEIVSTPDADTTDYNVFLTTDTALLTPPHPAGSGLGLSSTIDNVDYGSNNVYDGATDHKLIPDLIRAKSDLNGIQASMLLSEILNEHPDGQIDIYMDAYFRDLDIPSQNALVLTLGKTVVHELGHNVGLNHTYVEKYFEGRISASTDSQ